MENLLSWFLSPGAAYRGKPFWSWNGDLKEAELLRQIRVFKEMGFGGFFMHSRTGLVTDYLGDEWFRLTNLCADEAAKLGMEAWLYDEDRWPSGTAGGMITANPDYRQQFVSLVQMKPDEFAWHQTKHDEKSDDGRILAVFQARLDGLNVFDWRRLTPGQLAKGSGITLLVFRIEHAAESSFYNGNTYVDTMNRDATDAYLQITHEQYQSRCGDRMGKSIRGIFTDEPHRGPVMNGFSLSNDNRLWMAPWTPSLAEEFRTAFGYDLIDQLPALFLRPNGEAVAPVKWQYMELLQRLFLKNFAKPMFEWCQQHNMQLTGHALHEDSLTAQACMQGSLARFYEYMHLPGIDVLAEGNRSYWVAKQLSSVARQLGHKWLLSELYGCTGWQMGFAGHKAVGDWQTLLGINVRCHHLSWYTMEGEAKRDYPASISHQSAWWKDYRYVEDYFSRMGVLLSHGQPCSGVLVISPIESLWCQIRGGWAENLAPHDEPVKALESAYRELFTWLAGAQIEFDYGDEEMMSRLADVRLDEDSRPVLRFGRAEYRVVIVGRMTTIRSSTLRLLEQFAQLGGSVIFVGDPPRFVDAMSVRAASYISVGMKQVSWNQQALLGACRGGSDIHLEALRSDGSLANGVLSQVRRDEQGNLVLVVLNTDRENGIANARLRLAGAAIESEVAEWDCATGERFAVAGIFARDGTIHWSLDLTPGGSRAFLIGRKIAAGLVERPVYSARRRQPLNDPIPFTLTEPNVCVLDIASFQINDQPPQPPAEILKVDRAIRTAFGLQWRSGEMVQPWLRRRTQPHSPTKGRVRLCFRFDIDQMPRQAMELAMEQPHYFRVAINGIHLNTAAKSATGFWVDGAILRFAIPREILRLGENEVELQAEFHEGINLEALYLLGEFGVRTRGSGVGLIAIPSTLQSTDLTTQGLPFYGGAIRYHLHVPRNCRHADPRQRLLLELPGLDAACAKVVADGRPPAMLAWHPYRADVTDLVVNDELTVEVILTRRNTFGPLHQSPLLTPHYGPSNFTTEGSRWSDDFMLLPCGLLAAPILIEAEAVESEEEGVSVELPPALRRGKSRRVTASPGVLTHGGTHGRAQ
jgi:hypothetical protein